MASIISKSMVSGHSVDKYNFKVLSMNANAEQSVEAGATSLAASFTKEKNPSRRESDIDSSAMSQSSKDSLIESLLNKTDEMSSNFIKLQMKLETKEEEYEATLKKIKEESFNEGVEAGKIQALKNGEVSYSNSVEQFATSVITLDESAKKYETALENIKAELITAAIDIAKEVISTQVSKDSQMIAKVLADELIKELQSASKITLKVNPKDHGAISEHIGSLKHIVVISDRAINEGGVVAISDAGNIDSQISKRFERVKKVALSE
ncbi:flagellar assembly protein FliH [bacterium]|nr:flagellar assembly protein FliH [bacterium]MBU1994226.1 flagellar assembly protein FliH [bacterium]